MGVFTRAHTTPWRKMRHRQEVLSDLIAVDEEIVEKEQSGLSGSEMSLLFKERASLVCEAHDAGVPVNSLAHLLDLPNSRIGLILNPARRAAARKRNLQARRDRASKRSET